MNEDIFEIEVDEDNYVTNYRISENHRSELPDFTYYNKMNCYKYIDNEFIFDEEKYAKVQEDVAKLHHDYEVRVQIEELKKQLSYGDYKIIKCYEAQLVGEEPPYDMSEIHSQREEIRRQINELEKELL